MKGSHAQSDAGSNVTRYMPATRSSAKLRATFCKPPLSCTARRMRKLSRWRYRTISVKRKFSTSANGCRSRRTSVESFRSR